MQIDDIALKYYTIIDSIPSIEDLCDEQERIDRYLPFQDLPDRAVVAETIIDSLLFTSKITSSKVTSFEERHRKGVKFLLENVELALLSTDTFVRELAKLAYNNKEKFK
jgi:hypothetical protein